MDENTIMDIYRRHRISSPMEHGVTNGFTRCSCGAEWHTYYTDKGLEWIPLNDKCALHDAEMKQIPEPEKRWGGQRPGAGRRPLAADEPTIEGTINLPASLDSKAKRLGGGNRSAGIRKALESFTE